MNDLRRENAFLVKIGDQFAHREKKQAPLILVEFLQKLTGKTVILGPNLESPDLVLLSALDLRTAAERRARSGPFRKSWSIDRVAREISDSARLLVVSFENLHHPWWAKFGSALLASTLPRTSFFSPLVDPLGARFPYWWNYLDWPDFKRPDAIYRRYGRLYSLERMLEPIPKSRSRINRACWIGSASESEPRNSLLNLARQAYGLDVFGQAGEPFSGPKSAILEKYKFSVAAENSYGFGYDSEKLPEVWDSGCVPVATFLQPMTDFNPECLNIKDPSSANHHPLLLAPPNPEPLLDYLETVIR